MRDTPLTDEDAMRAAIDAALDAREAGEFPYGAVVVSPSGIVIGRAHDRVEADSDLTSHAEILAVRDAVVHYGRSLRGCTLVSTVEPCAMCFSAAWTAEITRLIYGLSMRDLSATNPEALDEISIDAIELNERTQRKLEITIGMLRDDCNALWTSPHE
jgi:tRNA(Arg) A34 adenosine deaminase TadA